MGRQGNFSENKQPTLENSSEEKTTELLLKGFLKNFLVEPLPRESCIKLSDVMRQRFAKERAIAFLTPNELVMKQVGQIALLSFGHYIEWQAASSHELIRLFFMDDDAIFNAIVPDLLIIYHGFDSLPNKLTSGNINQLCTSRAMRLKPTLVLERYDDPEVTAVIPQALNVALSSRPDIKLKGGKPKSTVSQLNLPNSGSGLSTDVPGLPPVDIC